MFELVTGDARHLPCCQGWPLLISTAVQVSVATAALTVPLLYVTDRIPDVPTMMAFVAAPVEAPPTVDPEPVATFGDDEGVPGGDRVACQAA